MLIISYITFFKEKFECVFDEFTKNNHTIKSSAVNIQTLADLIIYDSIRWWCVWAAKWKTSVLLQLDYDQLLNDSIDDFNAKYIDEDNDAVDSADFDSNNDMKEITDLSQDLWLFSLMIS